MVDFVRSHHHTINKNFLYAIGLWPHQFGVSKYTLLALTLFCMGSQSFLQTAGMLAAWEDKDVFLESIPPVLVDFVVGAKIINFISNFEKMKELLMVMEDDWKKFNGQREILIMEKYSLYGRQLTLLYAACMYGSMLPFMIVPAVPIFLDIFGSSNATNVKVPMFRVDFFLDAETYYYPLLIHSYICTWEFIAVVVAVDTMFMTFVRHACGCFAVLGYQLEHLMDGVDNNVDVYPPKTDDISYHHMVDCITQHNHALQYCSLIENANYKSYFIQLGFIMVCISFTGFQTVMQFDNPQVSIRYAAFTMTQLIILFLQSYPPQMLYDHSTQVADYVNNSGWYYTSIRTRVLVNLMILRSRIPCEVTAGKFYILNLASFSAVIRTSMSYLTVLTSMQ